ncbi:sulfotransferase [bacterium]|nr:sulfotransferase [bacterium]
MASIQPVFVFGYDHSGTSLLQNVLRQHPHVFSQRSESAFYQMPQYYRPLYPTLDSETSLNGMIAFCANLIITGHRRLYEVKTEPLDPDILTPDELTAIRATLPTNPPHRLVFPATFTFLAQQAGKRVWVEKTPDHTLQATQIMGEIPDALAVEIVRDGRDTISSKKLREQRLKARLKDGTATIDDQASRGMMEFDAFWNSLAWRSAIHAVNRARARFPDRICTVRYEDLTADPEGTVRRVCDFIGIDFQPQMLKTERSNIAGRDKLERDAGMGIVASAVGRWHSTLNRGEKALSTRLLHTELRQHGYPADVLSLTDRALSVFTALVSIPKIGKRVYNKLRNKGVRHTLNSLASYVRRIVPSR